MGIMSREHGRKVACYHRDNATSDGLKRYWQAVIDGMDKAPRS